MKSDGFHMKLRDRPLELRRSRTIAGKTDERRFENSLRVLSIAPTPVGHVTRKHAEPRGVVSHNRELGENFVAENTPLLFFFIRKRAYPQPFASDWLAAYFLPYKNANSPVKRAAFDPPARTTLFVRGDGFAKGSVGRSFCEKRSALPKCKCPRYRRTGRASS